MPGDLICFELSIEIYENKKHFLYINTAILAIFAELILAGTKLSNQPCIE